MINVGVVRCTVDEAHDRKRVRVLVTVGKEAVRLTVLQADNLQRALYKAAREAERIAETFDRRAAADGK